MAWSIEGYTISGIEPSIEPFGYDGVIIAGEARALDGSLITHWVDNKKTWHVTWEGVATADADSLFGSYLNTMNYLTWIPPYPVSDSGGVEVRIRNLKKVSTGTSATWTISCDMEEV